MKTNYKSIILALNVCFALAATVFAVPTLRTNGKIAFSSDRDGNREIYVMNADGTNQVRLTNNISFDDFPAWSPDGQKIAFLSHRTDGIWAVFIMNKDGTGRTEVIQVNNPNLYQHISWSPDGRRIAFQSVENGAENIVVVNPDGTNRQTITNGSYPSWSPDGSKILFSTGYALYTIRPDGSNLQLVLTIDFTRNIYNLHEPGWSPDGQNIIFGVTDSWEYLSIFTARADGTDLRWLAGGTGAGRHATDSDWSPDGGKFVYTSYTSNSQGWITDISKANINGSDHIRLTTTGKNYHPSWQPRVSATTPADFDGDGRSDVSVFRSSDQVWYLNQSTNGFSATQFGLSADKITPADYDGDGRTDISVYRDGTWFLLRSTLGFAAVQFGIAADIPVPADYTGDGRAELAVYRNGAWWIQDLTNNQTQVVNFGLSTDKPVVADYDGDGRADQAVYRGNGEWHLNRSLQGYAVVQFGLATDKPVPADYDGDGRADEAVYRDGTWYLLQSSNGFTAFQWGIASDIPAPADYDGDGKADAAVYRDGTWWIRQSTGGISIQQFGLAGDKPAPAAYLP